MRTIYAKYNRERLPRYQLGTYILEDINGKYVRKKALTLEAKTHLETIYLNYKKLTVEFPEFPIVPTYNFDEYLQFDFVNGPSLEEMLYNGLFNKDYTTFKGLLIEYMGFLTKSSLEDLSEIDETRFSEIFQCSLSVQGLKYTRLSNIDLTFDNLIISQNRFVMIDLEWVFDFPIPINFLLYRSLHFFYSKHYDDKVISLSEVLADMGISEEQVELFDRMEKGFQSYVMGTDYSYAYAKQYLKPTHTLNDLNQRLIASEINKSQNEKEHIKLQVEIERLERINKEFNIGFIKKLDQQSHLKSRISELELHSFNLELELNSLLKMKTEYEEAREYYEQAASHSRDYIDKTNHLLPKRSVKKLFDWGLGYKQHLLLLQQENQALRLQIDSCKKEQQIKSLSHESNMVQLKDHIEHMENKHSELLLKSNHFEVEFEKLSRSNHQHYILSEEFRTLYEKEKLETQHYKILFEELQQKYHLAVDELKKYK
ncbi:hypothetical protein [Paenibacillus gansuensis]|uniref:Aminoglycoside phosphotransferase domain-containing protein n=1 Tax=Paenibacillus gansuensis TaxID=306542 RepID=A0ABW5PFS4_9BACL